MSRPAVNVAVRAARAAGQIILRHMNRLESLAVVEKQQLDFVSEVDRMAEAEIIRELKRAYPAHAMLAEESGATGKSKNVWVIDPLDGTHNYLRGFPHFSVSIALLEHGDPIVGVVFDPLRGELFTASKGDGAFLNDRRMRVGKRPRTFVAPDLLRSISPMSPPVASTVSMKSDLNHGIWPRVVFSFAKLADAIAISSDATGCRRAAICSRAISKSSRR
jgi:3'-phosphoadenosine 5'-phosphosulfate (PAPS) 3'-phosphatase